MHRRPRLFCAAGCSVLCGVRLVCFAWRGCSTLPGGGVVLCGVIRLCGAGRSALCGGFSRAFCGRAVALRPEPAGRRCGARAGCRFRSDAAAGCGSRRSLRSAGRFSRAVSVVARRFPPSASRLLLPASCFPPPASCLPPLASCLPPCAVGTGRTVKNSGKHPEKRMLPVWLSE